MLEVILLVIVAFSLVVNATFLLGLLKVRALRRRRERSSQATPTTPVSIFKPLCGMDAELEANLRSFYEQAYPEFELLFGVQRADDPALDVVKRLAPEFPDVRTVLVFDDGYHAANPKVSNLIGIKPEARFDLMLISDSNIRVAPDYLATIVSEYESQNAAIVTNAFRAANKDSLGSRLESVQLNTFNAGGMAAGNLIAGETLVVGKSMLFKRSELPGDLNGHGDVLAEDQIIGLALVENTGRKAVLSSMVIDNVIAGLSLKAAYRRQRRWAVLRRWLNPKIYAGEFFLHTLGVALIALAISPTPALLIGFLGAWLIRGAMDIACENALGIRVNPFKAMLTTLFRDLAMLVGWASAWTSSTVAWRGIRYRVGAQTKLKALAADLPSHTPQRSVTRWPTREENALVAAAEALANSYPETPDDMKAQV